MLCGFPAFAVRLSGCGCAACFACCGPPFPTVWCALVAVVFAGLPPSATVPGALPFTAKGLLFSERVGLLLGDVVHLPLYSFFLLAMPSRCIAVFCFCCFACCAACPRPAGLHGRSLTVQGAGGFMTSAWRFLTCNQAQRPTHGEQGACSTWLSLSMLLPVSASLHGAEAALSRSVPEGVRLSCSDMPHALPSNQQCGASTVPSASSR